MDLPELIAAQHGVVSRAQATSLGVTGRQIEGLVKRREWEIVHRGVYRHRSVASTWTAGILAACLASNGVASHRSAAALWGIDGYRKPPPEVTVPTGRSARGLDVRVHHSTQWDRIDRCLRGGVPCTGLVRTIVDLGAVQSIRRLELAAESAMRTSDISWVDLRTGLIRHARQGRDGCGRLRLLLEARHGADELPRSEWSRLVATVITDAGLPKPRLEHAVHGQNGEVIAEVDLAWPRQKVMVELDSIRWHLNRRSFERDRARRNRMRVLGWTVLEVTWAQTIGSRQAFLKLIRSALKI